jgi:hypothetical protein
VKQLHAVLCAAAGLAGWWGASWGEGTERTEWTARTGEEAASSRSMDFMKSSGRGTGGAPSGSGALSGLPAQLAALRLEDAVDLAYSWPESTAQSLALALLECRRLATDDPFADRLAAPTGPPPKNGLEELAEKLPTGELDPRYSIDHDRLRRWAQGDPAAACAAILKMPAGESRTAAADVAAGALANHDPAAAMDLVMETGGEKFGEGAAKAWAALVLRPPGKNDESNGDRRFLDRMTAAQRDNLFNALAEEVRAGRYSAVPETREGDPVPKSDLERMALAVCEAGQCTPGMEAFFLQLAGHPDVAKKFQDPAWIFASGVDVRSRVVEILKAEALADLNPSAIGGELVEMIRNYSYNGPFQDGSTTVLDRAAPRLLPNLARSGHVAEAVQLLDNIQDRTVWRESFEAMLPYWMDADPAQARAAFARAPLTALERERWERHPAFVLNP